jgi:hypothetical protein
VECPFRIWGLGVYETMGVNVLGYAKYESSLKPSIRLFARTILLIQLGGIRRRVNFL